MSLTFAYSIDIFQHEKIDLSDALNDKIFLKFSDLQENTLFITYISKSKFYEKNTRITMETNNRNINYIYVSLLKITLQKKDYSLNILVTFYKKANI